jgi:FHA domain
MRGWYLLRSTLKRVKSLLIFTISRTRLNPCKHNTTSLFNITNTHVFGLVVLNRSFGNDTTLITVGREDGCSMQVNDNILSKVQLSIRRIEGYWVLSDGASGKPSTNGTWVVINQECQLKNGAIFKTDSTLFDVTSLTNQSKLIHITPIPHWLHSSHHSVSLLSRFDHDQLSLST